MCKIKNFNDFILERRIIKESVSSREIDRLIDMFERKEIITVMDYAKEYGFSFIGVIRYLLEEKNIDIEFIIRRFMLV